MHHNACIWVFTGNSDKEHSHLSTIPRVVTPWRASGVPAPSPVSRPHRRHHEAIELCSPAASAPRDLTPRRSRQLLSQLLQTPWPSQRLAGEDFFESATTFPFSARVRKGLDLSSRLPSSARPAPHAEDCALATPAGNRSYCGWPNPLSGARAVIPAQSFVHGLQHQCCRGWICSA